jgi:hypothetical protein
MGRGFENEIPAYTCKTKMIENRKDDIITTFYSKKATFACIALGYSVQMSVIIALLS